MAKATVITYGGRSFKMSDKIYEFAVLLSRSDTLLNEATKDEIADAARVLAFHLGHYRTRYGDIPATESLHLLTIDKITPEMAVTLVSGLEALIDVLKPMRVNCGGILCHQ